MRCSNGWKGPGLEVVGHTQALLYRLLCGKLWLPQMSLHKEWRVPATVKVQFADVRTDAKAAAERAIESYFLFVPVWMMLQTCWDLLDPSPSAA